MRSARWLLAATAALWVLIWPGAVVAQVADRCFAVSRAPSLIQPASMRLASLSPAEVRLTFVGHATWLIESAGGVKIATDYNDYIRPSGRARYRHHEPGPHHALLARSRSRHQACAARVEPRGRRPAKHDLTLGDVRVRNVATNIRDWSGGSIAYGNSIFIFELAGMCIGHLGHLHHTLTAQQVAHIGQLDVVMVAVDGSYTMDVEGVVETLKTLRARLILPMHYFNPYTLNRFLDAHRQRFSGREGSRSHDRRVAGNLAGRAQDPGAAGELTVLPRSRDVRQRRRPKAAAADPEAPAPAQPLPPHWA